MLSESSNNDPTTRYGLPVIYRLWALHVGRSKSKLAHICLNSIQWQIETMQTTNVVIICVMPLQYKLMVTRYNVWRCFYRIHTIIKQWSAILDCCPTMEPWIRYLWFLPSWLANQILLMLLLKYVMNLCQNHKSLMLWFPPWCTNIIVICTSRLK